MAKPAERASERRRREAVEFFRAMGAPPSNVLSSGEPLPSTAAAMRAARHLVGPSSEDRIRRVAHALDRLAAIRKPHPSRHV